MEKEIEKYTDEEVLDEFSDLVEEIKTDKIYTKDHYIAKIIKQIISLGVDRKDHEMILDVISKLDSRKHAKLLGDDISTRRSNDVIIEEIIKEQQELNVSEETIEEGKTEFSAPYLQKDNIVYSIGKRKTKYDEQYDYYEDKKVRKYINK